MMILDKKQSIPVQSINTTIDMTIKQTPDIEYNGDKKP